MEGRTRVGGERGYTSGLDSLSTTSSVSSSFSPRVASPALLVVQTKQFSWIFIVRTAEQLVTAIDIKIVYMLVRVGYPESCHDVQGVYIIAFNPILECIPVFSYLVL